MAPNHASWLSLLERGSQSGGIEIHSPCVQFLELSGKGLVQSVRSLDRDVIEFQREYAED